MWWHDEQLHVCEHPEPYKGGEHGFEQFTPSYPTGHSTTKTKGKGRIMESFDTMRVGR